MTGILKPSAWSRQGIIIRENPWSRIGLLKYRQEKNQSILQDMFPLEAFTAVVPDHQECMVHTECHLRDSMENENDLTWNGWMPALIQEMIYGNNMALAEGVGDEKIGGFEAGYGAIVQTAT